MYLSFFKESCKSERDFRFEDQSLQNVTTFKVGTVLFEVNMAAQFGFLMG